MSPSGLLLLSNQAHWLVYRNPGWRWLRKTLLTEGSLESRFGNVIIDQDREATEALQPTIIELDDTWVKEAVPVCKRSEPLWPVQAEWESAAKASNRARDHESLFILYFYAKSKFFSV